MKVNCPNCKKEVLWDAASSFRPFCSKRCQLIDLGQWADEEHSIPSNKNKQDLLPDNINAEDIDVEEIENMINKISRGSDSFFKN